LENRRGQDDKMSGRMWKTVETKAGEVRVVETERRGGKRGSKKKKRKHRKARRRKKQ